MKQFWYSYFTGSNKEHHLSASYASPTPQPPAESDYLPSTISSDAFVSSAATHPDGDQAVVGFDDDKYQPLDDSAYSDEIEDFHQVDTTSHYSVTDSVNSEGTTTHSSTSAMQLVMYTVLCSLHSHTD